MGDTILFSENLSGDCFDQICAERQVTRFSRGSLMWIWQVLSSRRNEALDTSTLS
ncbi:terminase gpA endonuclease subunit [uncultured Sulfitobacter sp.]|uniref:terminase gpA endonuclease subunit n=1 Tax=uncultured Sulfitobacter sp. TaxID=191468 RepID=UPI00345CBEC8